MVGYTDETLEEEEPQTPAYDQDNENIGRSLEGWVRAEDATVEEQDAQFDRGVCHFLDDED